MFSIEETSLNNLFLEPQSSELNLIRKLLTLAPRSARDVNVLHKSMFTITDYYPGLLAVREILLTFSLGDLD